MSDSGQPPAPPREQWPPGGGDRSALPVDRSRLEMIRRQAALPVTDRVALFEAMSRDAAWVREAVRVR